LEKAPAWWSWQQAWEAGTGGLKQIDPVGPNGETILEYSVFDAIRAGFEKLVFVIRRDIEDVFKAAVGKKFEGRIRVEYAFQELGALPEGFEVPPERKKPWGTAHAVYRGERLHRGTFRGHQRGRFLWPLRLCHSERVSSRCK
jgi:NDP-sugar pyrophosphorylase family protein